MKAKDFDLSKEIEFDFESGITAFKNNRLVIYDADSIGLLRQQLINMLGIEKARDFFLKFGYQKGFADFMQMKVYYDFDSEQELLFSGPMIHTWEGIVKAVPNEIRFDKLSGDFYFTGTWKNSYEAEQHLAFNDYSDEPVCWSLMGYASGWCTGFFEKPLLAIEPQCKGKGDAECTWLIKPLSEWGKEAEPYINSFNSFWSK